MLLHLREYAAADVDNGSYAMHVRPAVDTDRTLHFSAASPHGFSKKGSTMGGITVGSTTTTWVD